MHFIRINWVGNRPQDGMVNYFDVAKTHATTGETWQTIDLIITTEDQVVELTLTNT